MPAIVTPGAAKTTSSVVLARPASLGTVSLKTATSKPKPYMDMVRRHSFAAACFISTKLSSGGGTTPTGPTVPTTGQIWPRRG